MNEYAFGEFTFEFESKRELKGHLRASTENETVSADVDLGSRKSRKEFVEEAHELYEEEFPEFTLRRALNELATAVGEDAAAAAAMAASETTDDDNSPQGAAGTNPPEPGSDRHAKAMEILEAEDVLQRAARDMEQLGHIGEWNNKKLAFACAVSAQAQLPIQPSTHAQSSAGKNYLWDTALQLVPPELVFKRTGFSAKALFRTNMSLKHSVLYIQELAGSEGADFSIRTLQSDNVLKWEATEKQPDGTMANVEYEVEGPTVIVQTTTKNHLHPENETRVVPLYLDETAEQTEKITRAALRRAAGITAISSEKREQIRAAWHDAVRLLEPAEVTVPFAERIEVPSTPLRLRRDVPRLLNVIKLIAWVHQHTRERDEVGRIIATEGDFTMSISMVGDSFARAWKSLTPSEEKVLAACKGLPENLRKHGFKRPHVEQVLEKGREKMPPRTLKACLLTLSSNGYLESDGRKGAAGATYTMTGAEEIGGSITLSARLPIEENPKEAPANEPTLMGNSQSARSCPLPVSEQQQLTDEDEERAKGKIGQNETRPLKSDDLQVKYEKRQTGNGYDKKGKTKLGSYEYLDK